MYTATSRPADGYRVRAAILAAAILCLLAASSSPAGAAACFSSPSSCGYPDATNTGIPPGTELTASGSRTISTNGQVLGGVDLTGKLTITADNVTVQNSRLYRAASGNGTTVIQLENGADNFTIKDSEVYGGTGPNDAIESVVWNLSNNPGATAIRTYFHGCSECWHGSGIFRDAYIAVDAGYQGSHDENIYVCDGVVDVGHSTLINFNDQTSTVFGDTYCGGSNDITITDSLLAGGGQMLTMQAHSTSKVGTTNITGNHFARCLGAPYTANNGNWYCRGGSDEHGLFPYGGSYMIATEYYTGSGQIWLNNVWDDNLQPVCPNGKPGCGTAQPPPDAPAVARWTAPSYAVAGTAVTLDGTASTGDAPLSCAWSFENADGSSVLDTRSGCSVSYTFQQAGTKHVKLTVTDADGDTDSNKQSFSVASTSEPPPPDTPASAVWSVPSEAVVGVPVALEGGGSTGDAPVSCNWSFENADGSTVWETHSGCSLLFTFQLTGTKHVKLAVTDADGDTDSNKQSFSVASAPTPPPPDLPADAVWTAPSGAVTGTAVALDGTASTGDAPLSCAWSFENADGSSVLDTRSGCSVSYTFQQAGTKHVKLTVTDADGDTDSNKRSFDVTKPPPKGRGEEGNDGGKGKGKPTRAILSAPRQTRVGKAIKLDASASEGEEPLTCTWSFNNRSGRAVLEPRYGCMVILRFRQPGTKWVELNVQGPDGVPDSVRRAVRVKPRARTARAHRHRKKHNKHRRHIRHRRSLRA
jgi:PKD repeat protein